jgi:Flp pilus assembly protein TadD
MKPRTIGQAIFGAGVFCAGLTSLAFGQTLAVVQSPVFDIEYEVNEAALPLESVRLWFTTDGGSTWSEYGRDEDRISPIRFRSAGEGVYGFFFVLGNSAGASSAPPAKSTPPQQTALVDYTPPLVQLHQVRSVPSVGEMSVQIRWTAVDAHFAPRPIEILYGPSLEQATERATAEPIANTGMFDWRVPPEVTGSVAVKVVATDRAGHRAESESHWVEVTAPPSIIAPQEAVKLTAMPKPMDDAALAGSQRAKERAVQLFEQALEQAKSGQLAGGVSRLREAVKLDPHMTQAFAEMGGMLYLLGDLDRSMGAYEIALKQQANSREALRGIAKIHERKGLMPSAAEKLQTILRYNPKDAEVWLQLGDVAVHQGDEVRARECYMRASQIDPKAATVIADAKQRLTLMAEVSRNPAGKK